MKKILLVMLLLALFPLNTCSVPAKAESHPPGSTVIALQEASPVYNPEEADFPTLTGEVPQLGESETPQADENTTPQAIETTTEPAIETITLSFAGDCTIGDDEKYTWNTFDEIYRKVGDPAYFLKEAKTVFENDDFTFVNLEGTFTKATKKAEKEYRFKGDPSYVEILLKGSIEGVTLANNHTLDYFETGYADTVKTLSQAGIAFAYFDTTFIKEIKGMKIGFLGYKGWSHEKRSNDLLVKQVKEMRDQGVDFIVANYHWGDEKVYYPNALQKRMAHYAIDNGVDLVIGHHPHVIQGMETYKGKNILYSLGNFCYGGSPNPADKDTIIYQHLLTFDVQQHKIVGSEYKVIPALLSSDTAKNNYQPVIASGDQEKKINDKFKKISDGLKNK